MKWPRVTVRAAKLEDIPELQAHLYEQRDFFEQQDLKKAIVVVTEYDGQIAGFGAARLMWQIEPILLTKDFQRNAPHFAQQKATYLMIRELDGWIADRSRNLTGLHSYFCSIVGKRMRELALAFGMVQVYAKSKFFGRDT